MEKEVAIRQFIKNQEATIVTKSLIFIDVYDRYNYLFEDLQAWNPNPSCKSCNGYGIDDHGNSPKICFCNREESLYPNYIYPQSWKDSNCIPEVLAWLKSKLAEDNINLKELAELAFLTCQHTSDYKKILIEVLKVPELSINF